MRFFVVPVLLVASVPSIAWAQAEKQFKPPKIEKVSAGFQVHKGEFLEQSAYKVGLWTPVYIEIFGGSEGIKVDPNRPPPKETKDRPHLDIETNDNDDVGSRIQIPVEVDPGQTRLFVGYIKTGHMARGGQELSVTLQIYNRSLPMREPIRSDSLGTDAQVYLTLGSRLKDFHGAVVKMGQQQGGKGGDVNQMNFDFMRVAAFETDLARLPTTWYGYNGVDLMILSTESRPFLDGLRNDKERLTAIAQWVRRGGRLVIPIARENQQSVASLLQDKGKVPEVAWQPDIPVVPPRVTGNLQFERLAGVAAWGGANQMPFVRKEKTLRIRLPPSRSPSPRWIPATSPWVIGKFSPTAATPTNAP